MVAAKQIDKNLSAAIRISGISVSGGSANVSTQIGAVLATAGDEGVSVPTQALGGSNKIGVMVTHPNNRCEIYNGTTKEKIAGTGSEVYGRLTESGGVYTLSFFTLNAGNQVAHSFPSAVAIDFEFNYRFDFGRFPADGIVGSKNRNVSDDPTGTAGASLFTEMLTVTALNTVSDLTKNPNQVGNVMLVVNDAVYFPIGGAAAPFSISGKTISWSATNAKFNLETTDGLRVRYTTNE
jgi:hypothetical protein